MNVRRVTAAEVLRKVRPEAASGAQDLLSWTERYRRFGDQPMRVPAPLRALYRETSPYVVVMKGAQLGLSEWAINVALHTAETGRAGRGTALYVQPGGENVGDFVQARVNPAIDQSPRLSALVRSSGASRDPDKVGLRRIGPGYTYWRSSGSRAGLKSVPADTVILDEYDEMPEGTLALVHHRLDSSTEPQVRVLSTPTYVGAGIHPEYERGDQREFFIRCPECDTWQSLEWAKNVDRDPLSGRLIRVCVRCRESVEDAVACAWEVEGAGEWRALNPDGLHRSYRLGRLYRPHVDLAEVAEALSSSSESERREAWNQHLGLPYSPVGGQLSLEELERLCVAPFRMTEIAGVHDCWMGVDVGARLHVWIEWASDRWTPELVRYLVGAYEVDSFAEVDALMRRFGVRVCVVDAHPELRAARSFQGQWPGQVFLADYVRDRMPPLFTGAEHPDPRRQFRVQVDRTAAMDAVAGDLRDGQVLFPSDAASVPGLFAHLQAPVRRLVSDAAGNPRAVYDEGARPDHFFHAAVYAELALFIYQRLPRYEWVDVRQFSSIGSWDVPGAYGR